MSDETGGLSVNSVLIVDDEELVRDMLTRILRRQNYIPHEAADAEQALRILATTSIAVILCDRRLPGKDGDWLIEQVRERYPDIAIILVTGDDAVPERVISQRGVVGYIVKPFTAQTLYDVLRDAVVWHHAAARKRNS